MRQQPFRLYLLAVVLFLGLSAMILRLMLVSQEERVAAAGKGKGRYQLHVQLSTGTIYDCNMQPLTNSEPVIYAAAASNAEALASVFTKLADREAVDAEIAKGKPFICELTADAESTSQLRVLHGYRSQKGALPAQHLLGYRQNGKGTAGLEAAYSDWLAFCDCNADILFTVSAVGEVLAGAESGVTIDNAQGGGLVTTLDKTIQKITDTALSEIAPLSGAAVVTEVSSGDIKASSSYPVYSPQALADALDNAQTPFLNRALCAYNVGSVFKLVTASAALESGLTDGYTFTCSGQTEIYGQRFRCHNLAGHGMLDMEHAVIESCNPYFISLSTLISAAHFHDIAADLGFGKPIPLADGITSAAGYLPKTDELQIAAEKANLAFGQGQLLASPLQICAMTSCLANQGVYCAPRLVIGVTTDGKAPLSDTASAQHRAVSAETAQTVCRMMTAVLSENAHSNGTPQNTTAGGKTSTAQTGRYADDGSEYCHAWMTGFFPAENPKYAVTVFAENGGSGNETAAPVFRRIIEEMTRAGFTADR